MPFFGDAPSGCAAPRKLGGFFEQDAQIVDEAFAGGERNDFRTAEIYPADGGRRCKHGKTGCHILKHFCVTPAVGKERIERNIRHRQEVSFSFFVHDAKKTGVLRSRACNSFGSAPEDQEDDVRHCGSNFAEYELRSLDIRLRGASHEDRDRNLFLRVCQPLRLFQRDFSLLARRRHALRERAVRNDSYSLMGDFVQPGQRKPVSMRWSENQVRPRTEARLKLADEADQLGTRGSVVHEGAAHHALHVVRVVDGQDHFFRKRSGYKRIAPRTGKNHRVCFREHALSSCCVLGCEMPKKWKGDVEREDAPRLFPQRVSLGKMFLRERDVQFFQCRREAKISLLTALLKNSEVADVISGVSIETERSGASAVDSRE